jgi:hypothetical protein
LVFAEHAPLHGFGKNKFIAKESNITIVYVSTFIFSAKWRSWATGTEQAVNPTTQTYYTQLYPKHIIKRGPAQTGTRTEHNNVHSCALRMGVAHNRARRLARRAQP